MINSLLGASRIAASSLLTARGVRACVVAAEASPQLQYDVCVVGAGASGLAAAIRLKQSCLASERDISVCVVEKGKRVGAVFQPKFDCSHAVWASFVHIRRQRHP